VTGIAVGAAAYAYGIPPATCLVASGLCGLAGMLPDVDSDSSRSFKNCMHIAAVLGAMLTIQLSRMFRVDHDWGIFAASCVFFFILYTVGSIIQKLTIHRGMIHSLPAAVIAGEFIYLISEGDTTARTVKALGLFVGFLSHLILDEIYSIDSTGKEFKIKKSFGTAVKMIDYKHKHITATFYAIALLLGFVISNESAISDSLNIEIRHQNQIAEQSPPDVPPTTTVDTMVVATSSGSVRPAVSPESGYAENELFRRRRTRQSETVLPSDQPTFLQFPPTENEPPLSRLRMPAPITLPQ
jgi:membrane-bound metal-dependent hydrolase YbcI (DUF457 family)